MYRWTNVVSNKDSWKLVVCGSWLEAVKRMNQRVVISVLLEKYSPLRTSCHINVNIISIYPHSYQYRYQYHGTCHITSYHNSYNINSYRMVSYHFISYSYVLICIAYQYRCHDIKIWISKEFKWCSLSLDSRHENPTTPTECLWCESDHRSRSVQRLEHRCP